MASKIFRSLLSLELEEKIINITALAGLASVFLPWLSGEWLGGDSVMYTGFHFYTSFIGIVVFLLYALLLSVTLVPLLGGPQIVKKNNREFFRLCIAVQALVLTIAALSVLMKVTTEFSRISIRFGIGVTFIAGFIAVFYCFLKWQEYRKSLVLEHFHHPEDRPAQAFERQESHLPPPPPPPPLSPEEHHLRP